MKAKLIAVLAFISAVFAALFYRERANYKGAQLKGEKAARDTERKAVETMIDGMEAENDIKKDNSTNRDNFLD